MYEYDSGDCRCVSCGSATLRTKRVSNDIRVCVCKKCEKRLSVAFWDGIETVDARRTAQSQNKKEAYQMPRTSLDFMYKGKEYSLCYTISTLIELDRSGLLAQIASGERPLTMTRDLFFAAFEANHSDTPNSVRRKIFKEFSRTAENGSLLNSMCEMLSGVCETVIEVNKTISGIRW